MRSFKDGMQQRPAIASDARFALAPTASDFVNAMDLAIATSETQAIPTGAQFLQIAATKDVYAKFGTSGVTAAVPGDVTDGSAATLNPAMRRIPKGATHVALISAEACKATLEFWAA